jgi:hypothetical protein
LNADKTDLLRKDADKNGSFFKYEQKNKFFKIRFYQRFRFSESVKSASNFRYNNQIQ